MDSINNIEQLRELAWSFRSSRILHVANRLGIFDLLSAGPLKPSEIAEHCNSDPQMTEKILIVCSALGLIHFEEGKCKNSYLADCYLVSDSNFYQGHWIENASYLYDYWGKLNKFVGGKASEKTDYSHRNFILAMHDIAVGGEAEELAAYVDLKDKKLMYDVGGGPGTYSIILCKHNPELRAVVFDLPETVAIAKEVIEGFGMSHRISTRAGDWDKDDFGQDNDVILLSNVLHGPGSKADMKLKKAFDSMNDDGILIVRDYIMNEHKTGPLSQALFNVMVGAYSIDEITNLMSDAGFISIRDLPIPHRTHSILIAQKP